MKNNLKRNVQCPKIFLLQNICHRAKKAFNKAFFCDIKFAAKLK